MSHEDITSKDILINIFKHKIYRIALLFTILFGFVSHLLMHKVFDSFHNELMLNILDESKKVGTHIAVHQDYQEASLGVIDMAMSQIQKDFNIWKIKLFDKDGIVVSSTDPKDINTKNTNEYFYNQVVKGEIFYKIVTKNQPTLENEFVARDIAEIYIPIMKENVFLGSSEIYYDITDKKESLNRLIDKTDNIFMAVLSLSVLIILAMLYNLSKDDLLRRYARKKEEQMNLLMQQQSRLAALGEMMGNIAHQWRQPLSAITATMSGLELKNQVGILTSNDVSEANKNIMKSSEFLTKTIEDFRNFFHKDSPKHNFVLANTVRQVCNIIKASYDSQNIKLKLDLDNNIYINGSSSLLSQVILNILSNARDILTQNSTENKVVSIVLKE
ncbi:MAG: hypothetical protein WHU93_08485, partial [Arcobacteraceae bacterium]